MLHFPEPFELPPGFGLRQSSGALSDRGGDKAVEGHRTAMSSVKTWLALRFFCFFLNAVFVFPFRLSVFKTFPWRGQRRT
jgi:hypothetical protein